MPYIRNFTILAIVVASYLCYLPQCQAQSETTSYIGVNLPPMTGTTFEVVYEGNLSSWLSFCTSVGYVFNSELDSPHDIGTSHVFEKRSGLFVKPEVRINIRKDLSWFAPYVGANMVHGLAIEKGYNNSSPAYEGEGTFSTTSYNMGFSAILGVTSPSDRLISVDLGLQAGYIVIDHLVDYHSYMPGMGVNMDGMRVQGILRVKYRISGQLI